MKINTFTKVIASGAMATLLSMSMVTSCLLYTSDAADE